MVWDQSENGNIRLSNRKYHGVESAKIDVGRLNLTSSIPYTSTVTAPGAWKLLSSGSASRTDQGDATGFQIDSVFSSTYRKYKLIISNMLQDSTSPPFTVGDYNNVVLRYIVDGSVYTGSNYEKQQLHIERIGSYGWTDTTAAANLTLIYAGEEGSVAHMELEFNSPTSALGNVLKFDISDTLDWDIGGATDHKRQTGYGFCGWTGTACTGIDISLSPISFKEVDGFITFDYRLYALGE